jgi:DNA replication protein DnaC
MNDIEIMAKRLRLGNLRRHYKQLINEALDKQTSYEDFVAMVLQRECDDRRNNGIQKKIHGAHFPYIRTFDEFDWNAFSLPIANGIRELQSLSFVREGRNVILIGNPGVGKTHTAIALGVLACQANMSVLYITIPNLILELKEALKESEVVSYKRKFMAYDLVILDELGYISFDKDGSDLLFNLLSNRAETRSILITTNLTFDKWPTLFGDTILTTAIVDRLANKASIIQIVGESYRIKQTKNWLSSREN